MSSARLALVAARTYVSAAANTGGGKRAMQVLALVDKAIAEFKGEAGEAPKPPPAQPGAWQPPGGWPAEE